MSWHQVLIKAPIFSRQRASSASSDDLYAAAPVTFAATQQPCGENWRQARLQCLNAAEVLLWWLPSVSLRPSHSISPSHPRRPPPVLHLLRFSPPMGSGPGMDLSFSLITFITGDNLLSQFLEGCSSPCLTRSTSWKPVTFWQVLYLKVSMVIKPTYLI